MLRNSVRRRINASTVTVLALTLVLMSAPSATAADSGWQLSLTRQSAESAPSGTTVSFQAQISCSGVAAPTCDDGVIRVPMPPEMVASTAVVVTNPLVDSWRVEGLALVIALNPRTPAGTATSLSFTVESASYVVPNGTEVTVDATITGSNADSASSSANVTITAEDDFTIIKSNPGNLPDGMKAPLDTTVRYNITYCRADDLSTGKLRLQDPVLVDTLPAGVEFVGASGGGIYNPLTSTVSWNLGNLDKVPGACRAPMQWVDVNYPSSSFGPADTVINKAELSGTFIGEAVPIVRESEVTHGFGDVAATGILCKRFGGMLIPGDSVCTANVYGQTGIGPGAEGTTGSFTDISTALELLQVSNTSVVPGTWTFDDPIPCLANAVGPNSFGGIEYRSNAVGDLCQNPAQILVRVAASAASMTSALRSGAIFYYTTAGERKSFVESGSNFYVQRGDVAAQVSTDGVLVPPGLTVLYMGFYGSLDLEGNDSAVNYAPMKLSFANGKVEGTPKTQVRFITDIVGTAIKSMTATVITLHGGMYDAGKLGQPWTDGLTLTDLLPPGVTAGDVKLRAVTGQEPNTFPAGSYTLDFVDNYHGTGRTLVRFEVPAGRPLYQAGPMNFNGSPMVTVTLSPTSSAGFPRLPDGTRNDLRVFRGRGTGIDRCLVPANRPVLSGDTDDWNGNGVTDTEQFCGTSTPWVSTQVGAPLLSVVKEVKGNIDTTFEGFPSVGTVDQSLPGGVDYQLTIGNGGTVSASDFVAYDVFPAVGDTGVSAAQEGVQRSSQWRPTLQGAVNSPAEYEVAYSTAANPCRPEVGNGDATWPTGCSDDWNTALPTDPATVTAIRVSSSAPIASGDVAKVSWTMDLPAQTLAAGSTAWNSVAYSAVDADDTRMLTAETPKVGVTSALSDLSLTKSVTPTAASPGDPATYTVTLTHDTVIETDAATGAVKYVNRATGALSSAVAPGLGVVVSDPIPAGVVMVPGSAVVTRGTFDEATGVWNVGEVPVGSHHTLTFSATVQSTTTNTAEITANAVPDIDSELGTCVVGVNDHCASATITVADPGLTLLKEVRDPTSREWLDAPSDNGSFDPDGEYAQLASGAPTDFRFTVTNTSTVGLTNVLIDDPLINSACNFLPVDLGPGASRTITCTWPVGWSVGGHVNTATVVGLTPGKAEVTASDDAQFLVPRPAVTLMKSTQGVDANDPAGIDVPSVPPGEPVTWTYVITNTGEEALHNLALSDDMETSASFTCVVDGTSAPYILGPTGAPVPVGESVECEYTADAVATAGLAGGVYANTGRVTAQGQVSGAGASDEDLSHYRGTAPAPALSLNKSAMPAGMVTSEQVVTYTFTSTNTGDTPLTAVTISDPMTGLSALQCVVGEAVVPNGEVALAVGETVICSATYSPTPTDITNGQIVNTATATATGDGGNPLPATATVVTTTTLGEGPGGGTTPSPKPPTNPEENLPLTGAAISMLALMALVVLGIGVTLQISAARRNSTTGDV